MDTFSKAFGGILIRLSILNFGQEFGHLHYYLNLAPTPLSPPPLTSSSGEGKILEFPPFRFDGSILENGKIAERGARGVRWKTSNFEDQNTDRARNKIICP